MRYAGIDPGVTGAAAYLDDEGLVQVTDLPVGPLGIDPVALAELLDSWGPDCVIVEDNRAMGSNGSLANFNMGLTMGLILATIQLSRYPLVRVKPQEWQRRVGMATIPALERKETSRQRAIERWPHLRPELKRKKDHNRAEALWIAEAGRRG